MNFLLLKYIHILSIAASFALLFIRGVWLLQSYPPAQERWVKILPHIVDAVLLLSALGMLHAHAAAGKGDWMSIKLVLIVVYAASLVFLFITSVSVLHDPRGILLLLR